ncbi:4758_t:CDS:2, partial [Dentiscutata heterogama]
KGDFQNLIWNIISTFIIETGGATTLIRSLAMKDETRQNSDKMAKW